MAHLEHALIIAQSNDSVVHCRMKGCFDALDKKYVSLLALFLLQWKYSIIVRLPLPIAPDDSDRGEWASHIAVFSAMVCILHPSLLRSTRTQMIQM